MMLEEYILETNCIFYLLCLAVMKYFNKKKIKNVFF
jgi:hypothetical protein